MLVAADEASGLLKALANRHRLIIMCQLTEGERSVGELAALLELRDSTVSQHLAVLRKDGLVKTRRAGQTVWYAIADPAARAVVATLNGVYCAPAASCEPDRVTMTGSDIATRDACAMSMPEPARRATRVARPATAG